MTGADIKASTAQCPQRGTVDAIVSSLFYIEWKLSIFFRAVMRMIGRIVSEVIKRFGRSSKPRRSAMGNVTIFTPEAVNGYSEVRMYGGTEVERERMLAASHSNRRQNMKMALTEGLSNPLVMLLVSLAFAAITSFMLNPVLLSAMSTGDFIKFLVASGMLIKPIRQLTEINSAIQRGIAAAESIFEVIDSEQEEDTGEHSCDHVEGRFEFSDVSFIYPGTEQSVLSDLNFSVAPGQTIALVGSSGSGKTSLVSLISRFSRNQSGDIMLDGVSIHESTLTHLRSHIALVSQSVTLFNDTI